MEELWNVHRKLVQEYNEMIEHYINSGNANVDISQYVKIKVIKDSRKVSSENAGSQIDPTLVAGYQAFMALREEVKLNGIQDISLDEINAEIAEVRKLVEVFE